MTLALPEPLPQTEGAFSCAPVCTLCDTALRIVLDLGRQPLANALLSQPGNAPAFPLRLGHCPGCGHLQLADTVPPAELFTDYVYRTGASAPMVAHFELLAQILPAWMPTEKRYVCEVGSNDGTFLAALRGSSTKHTSGVKAIGVDPSSVARDVPGTITKFFNVETAREILAAHGPAGGVVMSNVLAHAEDPVALLEGARDLLPYGGILVVEVPYVVSMYDAGDWSGIYHEHAHFFSATVLDRMLRASGFVVERCQQMPVHGGTLRVFARRAVLGGREIVWRRGEGPLPAGMFHRCATWDALLDDEREHPRDWSAFERRTWGEVGRLRSLCAGKDVVGYGAPAKATVILGVAGIAPRFCTDTTADKQGKYLPVGGVPILHPEALDRCEPEAVLLLAHNYAAHIKAKEPRFADRWVVPFRPQA